MKLFEGKGIRVLVLLSVFWVMGLYLLHPAFADGLTITPDVNALCSDIKSATNNIATVIRGVAAFLTTIAIIVGGILHKTAFGDSKKVTIAKALYGGAILGLIIIFEADKIASVVLGIFNFKGPGC